MVTSPAEWPVWRTPKPIIVPRNIWHTYKYNIQQGGLETDCESFLRSVAPREREMTLSDVFGSLDTSRRPHETETLPAHPVDGAPSASKHSPCVYVACFHLPVRLVRDTDRGRWTAHWGESLIARSEGSVANELRTFWVGSVCAATESDGPIRTLDQEGIQMALRPMNCIPLFPSDSVVDGAYLGFCKQIIWPSFHNVDILDLTCACWKPTNCDPASVWDQAATEHWWDAYVALNLQFCNALTDMIRFGDVVWVHDYHLMLLPSMLSASESSSNPLRARIIFFLHIPFPTSQIFRSLSHGPELLHGIVGADVVGFHAFDHARHFLNACKRLMGLSHQSVQSGLTGVEYMGRTVMVVVRHVSIEPATIAHALHSDHAEDSVSPLPLDLFTAHASFELTNPGFDRRTVFASVDTCQRLSGLALKFLAFERFLWDYERWRGKVVLVQLAVREGKRPDDEMRTSSEITKLVLRINAAFPGTVYYRELAPLHITLGDRLALWSHASFLVGTAIREGLNLFPFEFIYTTQPPRSPGLVLASEFSATASLLNGALRLNPFDLTASAAAFDIALSMPPDEKAGRHARDLPNVLSRPSAQWTCEIIRDMWLVSDTPVGSTLGDQACGDIYLYNPVAVGGSPVYMHLGVDSVALFFRSTCVRVVVSLGALVEFGGNMGKYTKRKMKHADDDEHESFKRMPEKLQECLGDLAHSDVYVGSGVTMQSLMTTLRHQPGMGLVASYGLRHSHPIQVKSEAEAYHGVFKRIWVSSEFSIDWEVVERLTLPILKWFTARTNGSTILSRSPGLAWSYYRTDPEWGQTQANQLTQDLNNLIAPLDVLVHRAEGMIVIIPRRLQKGGNVDHVFAP